MVDYAHTDEIAMNDTRLTDMYRRSMENTYHGTAIVPYEWQRYHVDLQSSATHRGLRIIVTKLTDADTVSPHWPFVAETVLPQSVIEMRGEFAYSGLVDATLKRVHNQWLNFVTYGAMGN
jgi:hypothetical protein